MAAKSNLGDIPCPLCERAAFVRQFDSKNPSGSNAGKLYIWCPECGPIMSAAKGAQTAIAAKATMYQATRSAPVLEQPEAPAQRPKKSKKTRRALTRAHREAAPRREYTPAAAARPAAVQQQKKSVSFFELDD